AESGFTVDAVVFLRGTQGIKGAPEQLAHGMFCCVHGDTFRKKKKTGVTPLSPPQDVARPGLRESVVR
ncbi:hypothetical protein HEM33_025115, partial [Escherichia coli]|nr:hypothetical protein [Escherichia coli]